MLIVYSKLPTGCPKNLEPMGILVIFIYRLKLKVNGLKMALTLDERVEIVLLSGRQGWAQRQGANELQTVVLLLIPVC
jgi:hypothetical protein